jgi:hypothetical protein
MWRISYYKGVAEHNHKTIFFVLGKNHTHLNLL